MAKHCTCLGRSVEQRKARRQEQRARRQNERALHPPLVRLRAMYLSPEARRQVDAALTAPAHELAYDTNGICIGVVVHGKSRPNRPRWAGQRGPSGKRDADYRTPANECTTALSERDLDDIATTVARAGALMRMAQWKRDDAVNATAGLL